MRKIDCTIAWLLIAFGAVHLSLTQRVHPHIDIDAIWFASGGLLIMAVGALNLLRIAYGSAAKGMYVLSVIANIALLLLMLSITTVVPMRGNPQVLIGLVLTALLTAFSLLRRAGRTQPPQMPGAK